MKLFLALIFATVFVCVFAGKPREVTLFHLKEGLYRVVIPVPQDSMVYASILPGNNAVFLDVATGKEDAVNQTALVGLTHSAAEVFERGDELKLRIGGFDPNGTESDWAPMIITAISSDVPFRYAADASILFELRFTKSLTHNVTENYYFLRTPTTGYYLFYTDLPIFKSGAAIKLLDDTGNDEHGLYGNRTSAADHDLMMNFEMPTIDAKIIYTCTMGSTCASSVSEAANCPAAGCAMSNPFSPSTQDAAPAVNNKSLRDAKSGASASYDVGIGSLVVALAMGAM